MLSAAELSDMRDTEESLMPDTAIIIKRRTLSADGFGGFNETWGTAGTVACHLWPANRALSEHVGGGQLISQGDWYIKVPFDTDVKAQDRIYISSRTFEVVWVPNNQSWSTALRVGANSFNEEQRV